MQPPDPPPPARFRTLGTTELVAADGRPADAILAQPKRLALLAYLCVARPAGFRRREQLLALFWPELDDARARSALSQALHKLRTVLGKDVVVTRGPDEVGVDPARLACDVTELDRALAEGRVGAALDLYKGDLLPGLAISESPEFDHWLDDARAALRDRVAAAAWQAVDLARKTAPPADSARLARRAVDLAPYDEAGVRRCIELLAQAGDLSGAVRCYDEFAERVKRDLELEPSAETAALVAGLRGPRGPAAAIASAPAAAAEPAAALTWTAPFPTVSGTRLRRARWSWIAAVAGLLAAAITLGLMTRDGAAAGDADRVLVLPFAVSGDSGLAFLHEGMVDLLSTSVDGLARIQAVDPHAVLAGLGGADSSGAVTPERGAALARRLGAGAFVIGRVVGVAGRIEVSTVLYDSAGRRAALLSAEAPTLAGLPEAVDDLARQIVATRLAGPAQRLARLAALTTDSLEALRAYLTGEQLLRRGRHGAAADAFRAALAVDSLFPLAWFRLGVALEWVQFSSPERRGAVDRAMAMSPRLTERDRTLVRAYHAYSFGSLEESETLYRRLVTLYPEDVEAWYGLADALFHGGPLQGRPIAQAEPAFQRLLALQPDHVEARLHLARLLALRGDGGGRAALDSLVTATLPLLAPEAGHGLRLRALRAVALGDTATTRALVPAITALPENEIWEVAGLLGTMTADLDAAAALVGSLTQPWRSARWRAVGHMTLADLALAAGRWVEARRALDAVAREDPALALLTRASLSAEPWLPLPAAERDSVRHELERWDPAAPPSPVALETYPLLARIAPAIRLLDLVALAVLAGDTAGASRHLDALRALEPLAAPFPGDWELPGNARAAIALGAGRPGEALAVLEGLHPDRRFASYPHAPIVTHGLERWMRAEALRGAGRLREALDWYGTQTYYLALVNTTFDAPAWLRQGEIYEALGERAAARDAYQRVLRRWRRADPMFRPMIEAARAGLQRAGGGP